MTIVKRFFVSEKLSPKQSLTPEGFLLCLEVPIARTGTMEYTDEEIPITGDERGMVVVSRDEEEVFKPEFIASFEGKPVVNDHPPEDVNPANWFKYAKGTTINPRRGEGHASSFLVADLLIYDAETIKDVMSGKREVSCGYDAEYEEVAPGRGRQFNMVGNHVALVESGRCGPRCAIGDRKPSTPTGDSNMANTKRSKWLDRLAEKIRKAVKSKDEAAVEEALDEASEAVAELDEDPDTHIHLDMDPVGPRAMTDEDIESRFGDIEGKLQGIMDSLEEIRGISAGDTSIDPTEDELETGGPAGAEVSDEDIAEEVPSASAKDAEAIMSSRDSSPFHESFQETASLAEILVPGIRLPTFDAKVSPKKTLDAICGLRKTALDLAYNQADTRGMIDSLTGGKELKLSTMSCRDARTLFRAAANMKKLANDQARSTSSHASRASGGGLGVQGKIRTPAELNAAMANYYKN